MTKNTNTHTDWEAKIEGILEEAILAHDDGNCVLENYRDQIMNILADARKEVYEKVKNIGRYKTESGTYSEAELDKSLAIEFGYNRALYDVLATLKEGGDEK